jgi:DNA-binding CsgD family transcriptional regulator
MSVRTVEGHIYRACNKLGLARRGELAAVISESTPRFE